MPNLIEIYEDGGTFEITPEVREKMEQAKDLHQQIPEENVKDLHRVEVSGRFYCTVKRCLDLLIAVLGMIVLLIPFLILCVVIYVDDPGAVIFSQYRIGRKGKRFKLYKFRSMKTDTPKYMATIELEQPQQYVTRVGKLLRKLSLDEIPQLLNVIKGDMSLVGPRPLISDEYEMHAMRMRFGVYDVRPGITGLAQINGRDMIANEEKLRYDVQYLKEFGFLTDMKILLATVPKVLTSKDCAEGSRKQGSRP